MYCIAQEARGDTARLLADAKAAGDAVPASELAEMQEEVGPRPPPSPAAALPVSVSCKCMGMRGGAMQTW